MREGCLQLSALEERIMFFIKVRFNFIPVLHQIEFVDIGLLKRSLLLQTLTAVSLLVGHLAFGVPHPWLLLAYVETTTLFFSHHLFLPQYFEGVLTLEQSLIRVGIVHKPGNSLLYLLVFGSVNLHFLPIDCRRTMLSSPIPFPNAGLKATVLFLSFHPLLFGPRRNPSHQLILYLLFDSMKTVFKISL